MPHSTTSLCTVAQGRLRSEPAAEILSGVEGTRIRGNPIEDFSRMERPGQPPFNHFDRHPENQQTYRQWQRPRGGAFKQSPRLGP